MRISDWSSDVCSSDLPPVQGTGRGSAASLGHAGPDQASPAPARQGRGAVAGRARCRLRRPGAFQPVLPRCHRLVARALDQAARLFKTRSSRSRQRAGPTLVRTPARAPGRSVSMTWGNRSEEHTPELQSLMRISYAVFCLKKKQTHNNKTTDNIRVLNTTKVIQ